MDDEVFEDYDRELELALYREYRDVVSQFRYVVETERRFYLANEVELVRRDTEHDFYFELTMSDVWVWDVYRSDRFVKSVRVLTFKDVNVEELSARNSSCRRNSRSTSSRFAAWAGVPIETFLMRRHNGAHDDSSSLRWRRTRSGNPSRRSRRMFTDRRRRPERLPGRGGLLHRGC